MIPIFEKNVDQLSKNAFPTSESGKPYKALYYKGEEFEKLGDEDVHRLSKALENNSNFFGPLVLSWNNLSDLSALYLSQSVKKFSGLRGLDLSHNNLSTRSGEFLGEAFKGDYNIHYFNFKGNNLESLGTRRILECVNSNPNIQMLDIGIISDDGLRLLTTLLSKNSTLKRLRF